MKSIPLAALTLALPLVLSGCSSSPSLEDQTKLVEYEKCLKLYGDYYLLQLEKNRYVDSETMDRIKDSVKEAGQTLLTSPQEECVKYRP